MKIAVVNMPSVLADNDTNMKTAEKYIQYASKMEAEIICFPEFFNTGFALSPALLNAIRCKSEIEEELKHLSQKYNIAIGGSYINYDKTKNNNYNTYGLFFPDGNCFFHSKDIPTGLENFCYTNGDTVSAFETPLGRIGIVMCWEQLRYDTVKRMYGKVDLLVAGSCWWGFTPEDGATTYNLLSNLNRSLAQKAPSQFSRIMGVPIIHSSHIGTFTGSSMMNPELLCDRPVESITIVCDSHGKTILEAPETQGCYICEVEPGCTKKAEIPVSPDEYWIPALPPELINGFNALNAKYQKVYAKIMSSNYITK